MKKTIKQSSLRYRLKSLYDHGMTVDQIKDIVSGVEEFDTSVIGETGFISNKIVLDPTVIEDLASMLPTWNRVAKDSLSTLDVDEATDEEIIEEFLSGRDFSNILGEFRGQYYNVMNAIKDKYNMKTLQEAEAALLDTKSGKALVRGASTWGGKYKDKKISYTESKSTLQNLYEQSKLTIAELDKLYASTKGVRA